MSWTEVFAQQIYSFLLKRHSVDGIYSLMLHNTLECLKKIIFLFVRLFFFLIIKLNLLINLISIFSSFFTNLED